MFLPARPLLQGRRLEMAADEKRKTGDSRRKRRNSHHPTSGKYYAIWLLAGGIIMGCLTAGYAGTFRPAASLQAQADILPDGRAKEGTLHETQGQTLAQGDFWVVLNQIPVMDGETGECNLEYEKPESNHYSARVNLYLKSTGELLGGTRRVDPGNYVEIVKLKTMLAPGEYPVTARIELFRNKEPAGGLSLDMTLRVEEPEGGGND